MLNNFLLIDDDEDDRDLFYEALRKINSTIQLDTAPDGSEVIKKLKNDQFNPQIIFLDINMPGMNGWECLANLKADSELNKIPVIMYSTSPVVIDGQRAISNGAVCFLEKPPSFIKLREFLARLAISDIENLVGDLRTIALSKQYRMLVS